MNQSEILFVEPFYGGSHKQLIDTLIQEISCNYKLITLPAKKWPWRARCSALQLSQLIPHEKYATLFCSSVLSLAQLLGLRPDLNSARKIVYFHENQLVYPKQEIKQRDFQYGYNEITTCLAANTIIFNSYYNYNTFIDNISKFLKLMPDLRPKNITEIIKPKCCVLYFPITFANIPVAVKQLEVLHIVWPHRWEFDKGPDDFFAICFKLKDSGYPFKVAVLGEQFRRVPAIFETAKTRLSAEIVHWGYAPSKDKYYEVLNAAHVVVSTAKHEFYGVATLEAIHCGCYPLLPNRLVYPELYPKDCLFNDVDEAVSILKGLTPKLCKERRANMKIDLRNYDSKTLVPKYKSQFCDIYSIVIISTLSFFCSSCFASSFFVILKERGIFKSLFDL